MVPNTTGQEDDFNNTRPGSKGFGNNTTNMHVQHTFNGDVTCDHFISVENEIGGYLKEKVLELKEELLEKEEDLERLKAPDKFWNNPIK